MRGGCEDAAWHEAGIAFKPKPRRPLEIFSFGFDMFKI